MRFERKKKFSSQNTHLSVGFAVPNRLRLISHSKQIALFWSTWAKESVLISTNWHKHRSHMSLVKSDKWILSIFFCASAQKKVWKFRSELLWLSRVVAMQNDPFVTNCDTRVHAVTCWVLLMSQLLAESRRNAQSTRRDETAANVRQEGCRQIQRKTLRCKTRVKKSCKYFDQFRSNYQRNIFHRGATEIRWKVLIWNLIDFVDMLSFAIALGWNWTDSRTFSSWLGQIVEKRKHSNCVLRVRDNEPEIQRLNRCFTGRDKAVASWGVCGAKLMLWYWLQGRQNHLCPEWWRSFVKVCVNLPPGRGGGSVPPLY